MDPIREAEPQTWMVLAPVARAIHLAESMDDSDHVYSDSALPHT